MTLVFICQVIDEDDPIQSATIRWVKVLAEHKDIRYLHVISLYTGEYDLPENVTVYPIWGYSKILRLTSFYRHVVKIVSRNKVDGFFVHQAGPYPLLLLPTKYLCGIPIYQWKAHPHINRVMELSARHCDDLLFTATKNSFPLDLDSRKIVGHGINTDRFSDTGASRSKSLVTVGRLMPSKRIHLMIRAVEYCNNIFDVSYTLDVIGPLKGKRANKKYIGKIRDLISRLDLSSQVYLRGAVERNQLPALLSQYRLFLNLSTTALDKAVLEAMACRTPVLSTNPCVSDILHPPYDEILFASSADPKRLANRIHSVMSMSDSKMETTQKDVRQIVVDGNSDRSMMDKIVNEIHHHE